MDVHRVIIWLAFLALVASLGLHAGQRQREGVLQAEVLRLAEQARILAEGETARPIVVHAILRPDADGKWHIQNDIDHTPFGIDTVVEQAADHLKIFFCCLGAYTSAGSIQIGSDDGFAAAGVTGHANLGLTQSRIEVRVHGRLIDPADICDHLAICGDGNFFITATMLR